MDILIPSLFIHYWALTVCQTCWQKPGSPRWVRLASDIKKLIVVETDCTCKLSIFFKLWINSDITSFLWKYREGKGQWYEQDQAEINCLGCFHVGNSTWIPEWGCLKRHSIYWPQTTSPHSPPYCYRPVNISEPHLILNSLF